MSDYGRRERIEDALDYALDAVSRLRDGMSCTDDESTADVNAELDKARGHVAAAVSMIDSLPRDE